MIDKADRNDVDLGLCVEMVFTDMPLEQRMAKVASLGFTNVEVVLVDQVASDPEALAGFADRAGVRITNLVIGPPDGRIGGGLTDPRNRQQWLTRAKTALDYAAAANIRAAIVCTGNTVENLSESQMRQSVLDGLKATVDIAEDAGVTLLLEPLNTVVDHPGHWLTSSSLGADLCREVDSQRLRLLYDCYHMQIMEGDLGDHIERHLDVIGHFHAAGVPGRHEVDEGEIDYSRLLKRIRQSGYRGVFGLEYMPSIDHEASLRRTLAYLSRADED